MAFAGLSEGWRGPDGKIERTFAIVTTAANPDITDLHDRMPVIVESADWPAWPGEDAGEPAELLHPSPEGTLAFVAGRPPHGRSEEDDPELLKPVEAFGA